MASWFQELVQTDSSEAWNRHEAGRARLSMLPALDVRDLSVVFDTEEGPLAAVRGVSFRLDSGEVLGIVGESGSGKSVTGLALIGLLQPPGRVAGGSVRLLGQEILGLPEPELRPLRPAPGTDGSHGRADMSPRSTCLSGEQRANGPVPLVRAASPGSRWCSR